MSCLCRSWDMGKFLNTQCQLSRIKYPQFARKWINIRKSYGNYYKVCFHVHFLHDSLHTPSQIGNENK